MASFKTVSSDYTITANSGQGNINLAGNVVTTNAIATTAVVDTVQIGNFTLSQIGTKLMFAYNGANIASLDSTGAIIASGTITPSGTP